MKHKLCLLYSWLVRTFFFFWPDIPFIMRFRGWLYGLVMKKCGSDFQVSHSVIINGLEGLSVGNHVFINNNCLLLSSYGLYIGDGVIIGPSCVFSSNNHLCKDQSFRYGGREVAAIYIGAGSWIAANCTILSGAYIPVFSLIAAGSVYSIKKKSELDSGYVYGGVPAKIIKKIDNE